ncbi:MAG: RsbRD N-terminal domain-containing protein [Nitrospirae bacterium]|nr:RsbRD N-terminal domain-containing protein [Nitrospirota bacterium]
MKLNALLLEKKTEIIEKWFDAIVACYPPDTAQFLKNKKDRFTNPMGATILQGIENIFDKLLPDNDCSDIAPFLDNIIRIRAVQDFTPSQAVAFIFLLKKVIREELRQEIQENKLYEELLAFELKIDNLALSTFDIYMKCREKLYEIKANEVKNMTFRLLQQANLICEIPGYRPDVKDDDNIKK